jgi:hypothetical protein
MPHFNKTFFCSNRHYFLHYGIFQDYFLDCGLRLSYTKSQQSQSEMMQEVARLFSCFSALESSSCMAGYTSLATNSPPSVDFDCSSIYQSLNCNSFPCLSLKMAMESQNHKSYKDSYFRADRDFRIFHFHFTDYSSGYFENIFYHIIAYHILNLSLFHTSDPCLSHFSFIFPIIQNISDYLLNIELINPIDAL